MCQSDVTHISIVTDESGFSFLGPSPARASTVGVRNGKGQRQRQEPGQTFNRIRSQNLQECLDCSLRELEFVMSRVKELEHSIAVYRAALWTIGSQSGCTPITRIELPLVGAAFGLATDWPSTSPTNDVSNSNAIMPQILPCATSGQSSHGPRSCWHSLTFGDEDGRPIQSRGDSKHCLLGPLCRFCIDVNIDVDPSNAIMQQPVLCAHTPPVESPPTVQRDHMSHMWRYPISAPSVSTASSAAAGIYADD